MQNSLSSSAGSEKQTYLSSELQNVMKESLNENFFN